MAALAVASLLALAACGSDGKSDGGTTTPATSGGATTTAAGGSDTTSGGSGGSGGSAGPTTTAKADDSLAPVVVGFHNLEGGQISLPWIRQGFEQGVRYVNERLGGINGHPLKAVTCNTDVTPESSVNCANQFVEKDVVAAVQGVDVAADAALPILGQAGIPEIAFFPFSPTLDKSPGKAFVTLFSTEEVYAASLIAQQKLGAKKVAELIVDLPSGHAAYDEAVAPVAKKLGLDVQPFYYVQASVDWTSFAATVLTTKPDAIDFVAPTDADCTAAIPAFRSAGFTGVIHAGSCVEFRTQLPDSDIDNVINHNNFYESGMDKIPAKVQGDLDVYREFMKEGAPDAVDTVYGPLGFEIAVDAATMLQQVPTDQLTAAGAMAALPTAKGTKFFTESPYDCANPTWPGTSACGSQVLFSKVLPGGKLQILDFAPVDVSSVVPS